MYKDKFRFVKKMYRTLCAAHSYSTLLFQFVDKIKLGVWFESPSWSLKTRDWNWLLWR